MSTLVSVEYQTSVKSTENNRGVFAVSTKFYMPPQFIAYFPIFTTWVFCNHIHHQHNSKSYWIVAKYARNELKVNFFLVNWFVQRTDCKLTWCWLLTYLWQVFCSTMHVAKWTHQHDQSRIENPWVEWSGVSWWWWWCTNLPITWPYNTPMCSC